ncbi:hypothetical protein [uncultured Fibrobacter sp.]|uniref:5-methylcytosine restriction system specificity protein McrC n=1 Tax=uncultured Fibrobacter sp. TaxID=261512 RepID=UPI0025EC7B80|nr:hypothetical protein [uncultured Fibrobacter sp.]
MEEWLYNIIKNGTLVDNQSYVIEQGVVSNCRIGEPLILKSRRWRERKGPWNDEDGIWFFLNDVSREIAKKIRDKENCLILINDEEYEHNTDDNFFDVKGMNARNFILNTGNVIGFVKCGDYSLKIGSRFGDEFLRYIIADSDGFLELHDIGGETTNEEGYEWLLAYIWSTQLKKSYRLGLPKTYVSKNEKISRVRGRIDVIDYFQNNLSDKYLCSYREQSFMNDATSLFIKAYELIKKYSFCQRIRNIYSAFLVANQGNKKSVQELLNVPNFRNPYYNDYNRLIDLSKKILRRQDSNFDSKNDASAFFFDVSMLFEYFIRKLLKREGLLLHSKYEHVYKIPSGTFNSYMRKLEPDIVFECDGKLYLFDVKYKTYDFKYGVKRDDLFQLHTYIGQYGNDAELCGCGFIYPISEQKWDENNLDKSQGLISDVIIQQGRKISFSVVFLKIPQNSKDVNFNELMQNQCRNFLENLRKNVLKT